MAFNRQGRRRKIRYKIRKTLVGTAETPRVSIYRSNKQIYAQLIDDASGVTLISASSSDSSIPTEGTKIEIAKEVGKLLAKKSKDAKISSVKFDRSGYLYHGRVKSLAEGAREGGLQF